MKQFRKNTTFISGAKDIKSLQTFNLPQVSFLGRSNVGKSTLINLLCNNKRLSRVSKTPGCTKQLNFFSIDNKFILVDMPGYGFARVSSNASNNWSTLISYYLKNAYGLKMSYILVDSRRKLLEYDYMVMDILKSYNRKFIIIFTKIDKLNKTEVDSLNNYISNLINNLNESFYNNLLKEVLMVSNKNGKQINILQHNILQHII